LLAGFVRFTGDPKFADRLERLVMRLRENGVTANIFLALAIVLVANVVSARHALN